MFKHPTFSISSETGKIKTQQLTKQFVRTWKFALIVLKLKIPTLLICWKEEKQKVGGGVDFNR